MLVEDKVRSTPASFPWRRCRRAHGLTAEWLPKYAPELNDIEVVWHDLKAHHLAHHTFANADALDEAIHQAVDALNAERTVLPLAKPRISAMKIAWQVAGVMRASHGARSGHHHFHQ